MEERRFDELTRSLGRATSRRGVLKGLLGGLVAAVAGRSLGAPGVAAASCNVAHCKDAALQQLFFYRKTTCAGLCHHPRLQFACLACQMNAMHLFDQWLKDCESGDGCLSAVGEVCCEGQCIDVGADPNNCGTCGHVCQPGESCIQAECQCADNGTICDGQCVDTQLDSHNCGECGHVCPSCQACVNGACVDVECGFGKVCCQDQCIDSCPDGQQLDPTTCQCNSCAGLSDGATCGTNDICCGEQCLSTECGTNKTFDLRSCSCVCAPVTCPTGMTQDPETCQCVDRCALVTCDSCQQCDSETGTCVASDDSTECDGGTCCDGHCIASCDNNKSLDYNTCTCQCAPVTCQTGTVQDPVSCQCEVCEQDPDCVPPLIWDSNNCRCQNTCTEVCEPDGYICCTNRGQQNSTGLYYCCPSDTVCCDSLLGCCSG